MRVAFVGQRQEVGVALVERVGEVVGVAIAVNDVRQFALLAVAEARFVRLFVRNREGREDLRRGVEVARGSGLVAQLPEALVQRHREPELVVVVRKMPHGALGHRDLLALLLGLALLAAVRHGSFHRHHAEWIDLEREVVRNPRVALVLFVVEAQHLLGVDEEDAAVRGGPRAASRARFRWLDLPRPNTALADLHGNPIVRRAVEPVDLRAQHLPAHGSQGVMVLHEAQSRGQCRPSELQWLRRSVGLPLLGTIGSLQGLIETRDPQMEPRLRQGGRLRVFVVQNLRPLRKQPLSLRR